GPLYGSPYNSSFRACQLQKRECRQETTHLSSMPQNSTTPTRARHAARQHPLIVQTHLRWDFVWQRPQQLLSRLARTAPVLFIEEPLFSHDDAAPSPEVT